MISTSIVLFCLVAFKIASSSTTNPSCTTSASASPSISAPKMTSSSTTTSTSISLLAIINTTSSMPSSNSKFSPVSSSQIELATIPADTISIAPTIIESVPPATGTVSPAVFNANLAEAEGYNNLFSTLNLSSPCSNNEIACIGGNVGRCDCQGNFVITKVCSTGQQCFALPMQTIRGVFVGCTDTAAAIAELGLTSTSTSPSTNPSSSSAAAVPDSGCATVSSASSISAVTSEFGSTSIVPGCAYILASDLGTGALCSSDYCNCGGTVAPLLTSSVSGTLTTNCNYQTQPTVNSCPVPHTTSLSSMPTVIESVSITLATSKSPTVTELVVITCTTSRPGSSSCKAVTTSLL